MPLTAEQREIRKKGVTGSEVAALVGLNPYKSPQDIWEDKLGLREPDPELENNPHIERGVYLEPALIAWTGKRVGYPVYGNNRTYISKHNPLIIATPDGFADPEPGRRQVLEVKAPSPHTYEDWANPEEIADGIPPYYIPQVQWEMAATDIDEALVSTLIGGQLRVYRMRRSQPFIDTLTRRVEAFWGHVQRQEPPPVDFSRQAERDWMKRHFANQKNDEMRTFEAMDAEPVEEEVKKYLQIKADVDQAEEQLKQVKSLLQFFVGETAGFTTPNYKVTWKQSKASWKTDWKRFVATIGKAFPQHEEDFARLLRECDYESAGSRRFLVSQPKSKER